MTRKKWPCEARLFLVAVHGFVGHVLDQFDCFLGKALTEEFVAFLCRMYIVLQSVKIIRVNPFAPWQGFCSFHLSFTYHCPMRMRFVVHGKVIDATNDDVDIIALQIGSQLLNQSFQARRVNRTIKCVAKEYLNTIHNITDIFRSNCKAQSRTG